MARYSRRKTKLRRTLSKRLGRGTTIRRLLGYKRYLSGLKPRDSADAKLLAGEKIGVRNSIDIVSGKK